MNLIGPGVHGVELDWLVAEGVGRMGALELDITA
jgi:hypothetical protein